MLNTIGTVIITILIFLFLIYGGGLILIFHAIFETGDHSAKTRYNVASLMFGLSSGNLNLLHKTLDVILFGGKINTIEPNTNFHREYWLLGHKTAMKILKQQENLNIDLFWLTHNYESALKMMK